MSRHICIIASLLFVGNLNANVRVSEYKPIKTSIHDVSSVLGIQVYGGSFKTDSDFKAVHIRMSFIKNGKLLSNKTIGTGNSGLKSLRTGQVSVKIIDLDHLAIKGARSDSYRIHFTLLVNDGETASSFTDIPKSTFDISKGIGSSVLSQGNSEIKNPIFYVLGTNSGSIKAASDVNSIIKINEKADIMIAHLVFEE